MVSSRGYRRFPINVTDVGRYNIRNNIASRAGECGSETSYSRLQNVVPERRFQGFGMSFGTSFPAGVRNVVPERRFQGFGTSFRNVVSKASERRSATSCPGLRQGVETWFREVVIDVSELM